MMHYNDDLLINTTSPVVRRSRVLNRRFQLALVGGIVSLLFLAACLLPPLEFVSLAGQQVDISDFVGVQRAYAASDYSGPEEGDPEEGDPEDEIITYGIVVTRPHGILGTWVISGTHYTAVESTTVDGDPFIDSCVQVRVDESTPTVLTKITLKDMSTCNDEDDGSSSDDGDDGDNGEDDGNVDDDENGDFVIRRGYVASRPVSVAGKWVISHVVHSIQVEYTALEGTEAIGELAVGACAEVMVAKNAPSFIVRIQEKDSLLCSSIGDDDFEDYFRRDWEGMLFSVPDAKTGMWTILVDKNKRVNFQTNLDTQFDLDDGSAFQVGRWVEVKVKRRLDGSLLAYRMRVDDHELGEVVVRLESPDYAESIATKYNLVLTSTLLSTANIYLFATPDADDETNLVQQIANEEGVVWAEVNFVNSVPEDDGYKTWGWGGKSEPEAYAKQNAFEQVRLGPASLYYHGEGVVVAILDTGIYTPHEQFVDRLNLPSLDVIADDTDPSEVGPGLAWGHGTHIAGVIAAIAPNAHILPVRVLDEHGRGNTFLLAYAIEWAAEQPGVQVINLSLGTRFDSKILRDVIAETVAKGIIVVAAAGNDATNEIQYPAGYLDVIGVTAVDPNSIKASFANYGSDRVDISAPGVAIMSTMISEEGAGYATWTGTSMATAFVSGAAALAVQKWEFGHADGTQTGIIAQIVDSGAEVDSLNPQYAGQIGRLLDVSAVLQVEPGVLFIPQTLR